VYQPLDDHAAREALATVSADGFIFGTWSIFGTSDGGLAVNVDLDRGTLLVVRPDGVLRTALQGYYTQVRLTVAPGDGVLRALGDQPIMRWGASAISAYGPELPVLETLPGRIRTELIIPGSGGLTYQPDPVVLENGTIIWSPTTNTLFASCIHGGRTRWILEYDSSASHGPRGLLGDADGGFYLFAAQLYRMSGDGEVLAQREPPDVGSNWTPTSYSPRCGVGVYATESGVVDGRRQAINHRVLYLSGPNLESERVVPLGCTPTADCGALGFWTAEDGYELRRYTADGERVWTYPTIVPPTLYSVIELADGSVLIIWEDGDRAPALTLIDPAGVALEMPLDPEQVGPQLTLGAHYVTPDGVLYLASQGSFLANPRIVAIELGIGPAMPYPHGDGMDWARTNAAWLSAR